MDAETKRRALFDLSLEVANLKQKAEDLGVLQILPDGSIHLGQKDFFKTFKGEHITIQKRHSISFSFEAIVKSYGIEIFTLLTEEQSKKYGVAADE